MVGTTPDGFTPPPMTTAEYRQWLQQCVHCGLCLETCPTYSILGTEMDSPRGRIALLRAAAAGQLSREAFLGAFAQHIDLCLGCLACQTACPSGVQYGRLIEGARISLEELRPVSGRGRAVRWLGMSQLMPNARRLKGMARALWLYEKCGLQWLARTVNVLPKTLEALENILPPISLRGGDGSQPVPAMGNRRGKVAFFRGCFQAAFLVRVNAATVRVLQRNGYEVHFPPAQTCCGAAQWHTGDEELTRQLARRNIDAFLGDDYDAIINNAGGCGHTLKEYPRLLQADPAYAQKAAQFAAKVKDFSEFIAGNLAEPPQGELRLRATYVDSCHLRHGQQVIDPPRALLRCIPGLTLAELKHPDLCCGSAGVYNLVQPEVATALLDAKIADITATGAQVVVVSNTGCHLQLIAGIRRARLDLRVMHIAEVLDYAYRLDKAFPTGTVRHPRPLFKRDRTPRRWLAWLAKRRQAIAGNSALASLKTALEPGQVIDDPTELLVYELDGGLDSGKPTGVVFPYCVEDIQKVVRWAATHQVPLVARGAGTGLSGCAVAEQGGLLLLFTQMKTILDYDPAGRSAVIQPGVINQTLGELVKADGLYFPPDPASGRASALGGNIATNAGGPHCFKYGVTANYITGLDVVLADGRQVTLGGRALDYPEYDFVGLLTGSEGTLGVITAASVSLRADPPAVKTMMAAFDSVEQAGEAVSAIIAAGLIPATLELLDQGFMRAIEDYVHPGLPVEAGAVLIIEVDGYPESVGPQIDEIAAVLRELGVRDLRIAQTAAERDRLWYGRKSAAGAAARLAPAGYILDGTVPRSRLAETLARVNAICSELNLGVVYIAHAGDGNLHPHILVTDPANPEFMRRVHEAGHRISKLCVDLGGTITGEHGVGIEKRDFMAFMFDADELAVMQEIKDVFDPAGLLNPGKIFPAQIPAPESQPAPGEPPASPYAPATAEEAAEAIRAWTSAGQRIRVRGAGTKSTLFPAADVLLSTGHLRGIREYTLDDLYVTVGAGTPLSDLNAELAHDGMMVPLVSPWPEATVGGIVASNFNAPLRMRYGGVRDVVWALTAVGPAGRLIRAGRPLMKNVAGYDLVKLFVGSYGTLGLLTAISLKLTPLPRARATCAVPVDGLTTGLAWGRRLLRQALIAASILLCRGVDDLPGGDGGYTLVYTAEGLAEDVAAELSAVHTTLAAVGAPQPAEMAITGSDLWAAWLRSTPVAATLVRAGLAPKDLPALLPGDLASALDGCPFIADLASGFLYLRGVQDLPGLRRVVRRQNGYAVALQAAPAARDNLDRWGYVPGSLDLMRALKARWDRQGLLNPNVFVE